MSPAWSRAMLPRLEDCEQAEGGRSFPKEPCCATAVSMKLRKHKIGGRLSSQLCHRPPAVQSAAAGCALRLHLPFCRMRFVYTLWSVHSRAWCPNISFIHSFIASGPCSPRRRAPPRPPAPRAPGGAPGRSAPHTPAAAPGRRPVPGRRPARSRQVGGSIAPARAWATGSRLSKRRPGIVAAMRLAAARSGKRETAAARVATTASLDGTAALTVK